jgi:protein-L-isoaspartate(D-aspartate) O-methyltransferase
LIDRERIQGIGMTSQRTRERLARTLGDRGIRDARVLNVLRHTPRHLFVDEALSSRSYEDTALPIGYGQTISQPWVVARMTEELIRDWVPSRVLEIGTGSGYQAAVLAALVDQVYTIERVRGLYERTQHLFRELSLSNVRQRLGDGYEGWPSAAPFDAIILTAAPECVPETLVTQLRDGGRLVAPVGGEGAPQVLEVMERQADGTLRRESVAPVAFVPMREGVE